MKGKIVLIVCMTALSLIGCSSQEEHSLDKIQEGQKTNVQVSPDNEAPPSPSK